MNIFGCGYQGKFLERVAVGHGEGRCIMLRGDPGGSSAPTQPQPSCPALPQQCLRAKVEAELVVSTTLAAGLTHEEFVAAVN